MIYDFSEKKNEQEQVGEKLRQMKQEYESMQMSEAQLQELRQSIEKADRDNKKEHRNHNMVKYVAGFAAAMAVFVALPNTSASVAHAMEQIPVIGKLVEVVTFRDYKYESDTKTADIEVPKLDVVDIENSANVEENSGITPENAEVQETLKKTAEEINAEIQRITGEIIADFEATLENEDGYKDVIVKSEVVATTEDFFTLKLMCYEAAASGYEWNYYYTIDLETGKRLQLKDIFGEDTDYITLISENIKEQMQAQMDADENVIYWLNDEMEELNFKQITEETSFYLNEDRHVVIAFNEGDVAPMYMGTVEFVIPAEVLKDIRK